MFGDPLKKYKKKYNEMYAKLFELQDMLSKMKFDSEEGQKISTEIDAKKAEIDFFVESEYAKKIFELYNKKKPLLIRLKTNEIISWKDAFGSEYEKIPTNLRHSLVGLVEGGGRYRIK